MAFWAEASRQAQQPTFATLDVMRRWWIGLSSPARRRQAICEDLFPNLMLTALQPLVDAGWMLPVVTRYLERITDTVHLSEPAYVTALTRYNVTAQQLAQAARAMGDEHRYDGSIADLSNEDGHDVGFPTRRVRALLLLGHLYVRQGRRTDARHMLEGAQRRDAVVALPFAVELARAHADTLQLLRTLAEYWLTYTAQYPDAHRHDTYAQLTSLYRVVNHGTLTGFDTLLTWAYRQATFDLPVRIQSWQPDADSRSEAPVTTKVASVPRTSLVQYETWVGCPPCAVHDYAVRGLEQRFGDHAIIVAYHYAGVLSLPGWSHPDGAHLKLDMMAVRMGNTSGQYVSNAPSMCNQMWVDGSCVRVPAALHLGGRHNALLVYDQTAAALTHRLEVPASVHLDGTTQRIGDRIVTEARVQSIATFNGPARRHVKLHMVLVEDSIPIVGVNSPIQRYVARAIAGDSTSDFGYPLVLSNDTTTQRLTHTFDLLHIGSALQQKIFRPRRGVQEGTLHARELDAVPMATKYNPQHLAVVVYVQDQATGEVLQAARAQIPSLR